MYGIINLPYDKLSIKFLVAFFIWMQKEDIGLCSIGHCFLWQEDQGCRRVKT